MSAPTRRKSGPTAKARRIKPIRKGSAGGAKKPGAADQPRQRAFGESARSNAAENSPFNALLSQLFGKRALPPGPVAAQLTAELNKADAAATELPARLLAALHALVLERKADSLAALYPTNNPLEPYQLPNPFCPESFVCETEDTSENLSKFGKCIDAMNCAMLVGMTTGTRSRSEKALFMHQVTNSHHVLTALNFQHLTVIVHKIVSLP